ncbi:MAG: metallophosphoesterase [Bacteroidales bacterium]|nr:metallophosphoesterase [Bacteroidales bacterium]
MKIAFTADLHLKTSGETPERYDALEFILNELTNRKINQLIIAGDTFNREAYSYNDFNSLCTKFNHIQITLIPGNHDTEIDKRFFPADNIEVINKSGTKVFDNTSFLFIPYDAAGTMDEYIAEFFHDNEIPEKWILIAHGDYYSSGRTANLYEPGVYMPLSVTAITKFNPMRVIPGHIHKPMESGRVIYPGSPCGLEINETGKRRFLIYDTGNNSFESIFINTGTIFMKETLMTFPVENETEIIKNSIDRMISNWNLTPDEQKRVRLRLFINGFSNDLTKLKDSITRHIGQKGISFYDVDGPDLSDVKVVQTMEEERIILLEKVREKIKKLPGNASEEKLLEKIMEFIFIDK